MKDLVEVIAKSLVDYPDEVTVTQVEKYLMKKLPEEIWSEAHHWLIFFGRYQCPARKHDHDQCIALVKEHMNEN